jgi:hypothetical protein
VNAILPNLSADRCLFLPIIRMGKCGDSPDRVGPCFRSGLDGTPSALVAHIIPVRPGSPAVGIVVEDHVVIIPPNISGTRPRHRKNRGAQALMPPANITPHAGTWGPEAD